MSNNAALVLVVLIIAFALMVGKVSGVYRDTMFEKNIGNIHPCMLSDEYRSKWWTEERCQEWSDKYEEWKKTQ